jgi:hypothetical protein
LLSAVAAAAGPAWDPDVEEARFANELGSARVSFLNMSAREEGCVVVVVVVDVLQVVSDATGSAAATSNNNNSVRCG